MTTLQLLALWGSFLSGLGALAALIISIFQTNRNSRISEANFWLTLRESFNSPDRKFVHQNLREGNWKNNAPTEYCDWVMIEDYMGLFEVCERMLERNILDEKIFRGLYEYRIYNIITNTELTKSKLIYEYYDWEYFYKLLSRLYGNVWMEFYCFLKTKEHDYCVVTSEEDFLSRFNMKEKAIYNEYKRKLQIN